MVRVLGLRVLGFRVGICGYTAPRWGVYRNIYGFGLEGLEFGRGASDP